MYQFGIDRNSLFQRRGLAPDNSTANRRFHAFSLTPRFNTAVLKCNT